MKKAIFLIFLIMISSLVVSANDIPCLDGASPLLLGQEYCSSYQSSLFSFVSPNHYELDYMSVFTHYFNIEQDEDEPLNLYIDFGFDLNNPNPTLNADKYRIVEEYDFYNYIRPSSSKSVIDNFMDYRVSTEDYYNLEVKDYDFIGSPVYITSCFLDCNVNDNIPAVKFDLSGVSDIWYRSMIDTYDINTNGLVPYNWITERFTTDYKFKVPYVLRFENNFYQCSYDTTGVKSVAMGCTFNKDNFLRFPNLDGVSNTWDLRDILPGSFPTDSDNKNTWTIQKRIEVDIDNKNYSVSITTQEPNGGDYIPPTGEGILEQSVNNMNIEQQKSIYLLKQTAELENKWQIAMLSIIDIVFILLLIIYNLFAGFVLMFFFFGSFPYIFKKFNDKLHDLMTLKRRKF